MTTTPATPDRPLIGLEVHDASLWEPSRVLPIIDTMERWGYNALVLHQNDLLDVCTQLSLTANYGVSDLRLKKVRNNAAWLNRLVKRLDRFDAQLFIEIKEPSFHDSALEQFPQLLGTDGRPDPMQPDWPRFCMLKTEDLLQRVPNLGGLIITLASPESRVSMPDFLATHGDSGQRDDWFGAMIDAFRMPLARNGKALFVRDFTYTTDLQSEVMSAISRSPGTVGASIKITAHDYFPEFPENPAIAKAQEPLILEFEAFGEHTGWSVIPNCRVAEFQRRISGNRRGGVTGILMRTSWEAITGANALDTLSAANVFALPKLLEQDHDAKALLVTWLSEVYGGSADALEAAADLLLQSWQIPAAAYWQGEVFPRHSCLPSSWQEGLLSMVSSGMGRRDREIAIQSDDLRLSETAREALFAAKSAATQMARSLAADARDLQPQLKPELADQFKAFDWLPAFALQFELATKATFFAARAHPLDLEHLVALKDGLHALANELQIRLDADVSLPHHHRVLFDPEQIRRFTASLPR